jgi:hypothetical protein
MRTSDKWARNIKALEIFVDTHGHARVPAITRVSVDGSDISLGSWVSYLRVKYRAGSLSSEKQAQLEGFAGWSWGPCKPGPLGDAQRDEAMLNARKSGRSLQSIADEYGLSRQRVHQILRRVHSPQLLNA